MVLASHVIFSAYGFWLPNDPRGSWSDFVGAWELARFGKATKVDGRHSLAGRSHDRSARLAAKGALKYPPVKFTGLQARSVGNGLGAFIRKNGITVWACAILPEHVHIVVARHRYHVEQIVNLLKGAATRQLVGDVNHPLAGYAAPGSRVPTCWGRGEWKVFLNSGADIERSIRYVEDNPLKEGKPRQRWDFVTKFEGVATLPFGSRLNG